MTEQGYLFGSLPVPMEDTCRYCPFISDDSTTCTVATTLSGDHPITEAEYFASCRPDWCPIRKEPRR